MPVKWIFKRILLFYLCGNFAFFAYVPLSQPWQYVGHSPQPVQVTRPEDTGLSLTQFMEILDDIDLSYGGRERTEFERIEQTVGEAAGVFFWPASFALRIMYFIGYMGPATSAQKAFTYSVKKRYNYLARLAIENGMKRDGYLYAVDDGLRKTNRMSFAEFRHRLENSIPIIENESFETPFVRTYDYNVPEWRISGRTDTAAFVERISGFSADGGQTLGMEQSTSVTQDLEAVYQPNSVYTLRVAVGNRPVGTQKDNLSTIALSTDTGHPQFVQSFDASKIDAGKFQSIEVVADTSEAVELTGKKIRVLLAAAGWGRSHFDKVEIFRKQKIPAR